MILSPGSLYSFLFRSDIWRCRPIRSTTRNVMQKIEIPKKELWSNYSSIFSDITLSSSQCRRQSATKFFPLPPYIFYITFSKYYHISSTIGKEKCVCVWRRWRGLDKTLSSFQWRSCPSILSISPLQNIDGKILPNFHLRMISKNGAFFQRVSFFIKGQDFFFRQHLVANTQSHSKCDF